jgi:hypothetical protein
VSRPDAMSDAGRNSFGGSSVDSTVTNEQIGYHPEYSWVAAQRKNIRTVMDTLWFESMIIVLVLVYAVVLFVDMTTSNDTNVDPEECFAIIDKAAVLRYGDPAYNLTLADLCDLREVQGVLYWLDLIFLIIFLTEIGFRLLGFGYRYLLDPISAGDAFIVGGAFITSLLPDEVFQGAGFLNLLRIIRLFRLAVIINRLQRSRDAAAMRSKRAMYRRMGAPVEKVLNFLSEFRARQRSQRDQYNIDWMMEVIASDELYAVADFDEENIIAGGAAASGTGNAGDMARFLSSETGLARRRQGSFDEGEDEDEEGMLGGAAADSKLGAAHMGNRAISEATLQLWAGAAIATSGLSLKLQKLVSPDAWSFDVFEYDVACSLLPEPGTGKTATLLCYYLLEQHGVIDALQIERAKILGWLTKIDEGYLPTNPYHNSLHAADVCANIDYFLRQPNLNRHLAPLDILACLTAALMHDMGHPGVNNTFLEATKHELAITYNDVSVLENHHVAAAFKLLKTKELDWTKSLSIDDYKDYRETVIGMVLGTDMRAHFEHLTKFKSKIAGEGFVNAQLERKDTRLLMTMALHAADIANPAKPQVIATAWARRSMEEFFRQGDREAELSLPVSPFMDRSKVPLAATIVNCQIGFINVLVRPLLSEWAAFLGPEAERDILVQLEATLRLWENSGAKVIDSWGDFSSVSGKAGASEAAGGGTPSKKGGKEGRKTESGGSSTRNLQA